MEIKLNRVEDITKFNKIVCSFESDIDVKRGRYVLDAKSLMGVYTLDLSRPITVSIISSDREEIEKFESEMEQFKVDNE